MTRVLSASATSARNEQVPLAPQPVDDEGGLLAHADRRGVQVLQADGRGHPRRHRPAGDHRQLLGGDPHDQLGQQRGEPRLQPGLPRGHPPGRGHPLGERARRCP